MYITNPLGSRTMIMSTFDAAAPAPTFIETFTSVPRVAPVPAITTDWPPADVVTWRSRSELCAPELRFTAETTGFSACATAVATSAASTAARETRTRRTTLMVRTTSGLSMTRWVRST